MNRSPKRLSRRHIGSLIGLALFVSDAVFGQAMRDPTEPPVSFTAPSAASRPPKDEFKLEHLVTINGVRYMVWNARRYAVGDRINGARIERITESSISLKNAGSVRTIQLFPSIEKRPVGGSTPASASTRTSMDSKDGTKK